MKTIISLTTIPTRLYNAKKGIMSILDQGYETHLYIPEYCKRTKTKFENVYPNWLNGKKLHIHIVEDLGPITKLLYAVEEDCDFIITADDDVIYGKDWAKDLEDEIRAWNNGWPSFDAICYRGKNIEKDVPYNDSPVITNPENSVHVCNFITGTWGAIYRREPVFNGKAWMLEKSKDHPTVDDVVISAWLNNNNYSCAVIAPKKEPKPYFSFRHDCLWKINKTRKEKNNNDKAIESLWKW